MLRRWSGHASTLWWCLRGYAAAVNARRVTVARLAHTPPQKILVVCYGNIYRSPLAAALLRQRVDDVVEVRSAGFHGVRGRVAPPAHVAMSARLGVDLKSHRSDIVTYADVAWADIIVLMDRRNWQALRRMDADPRKFVWLGALDGALEVPDPYGMPEAAACTVITRLQQCTGALAAAIASRRRPAS